MQPNAYSRPDDRELLRASLRLGHEYEASLVIRCGAELLLSASTDPRSDEGYTAVKANMSDALWKL